ncbi:hypothetical protein NQZ68_030954 [Dissostichus eleginoides]|nr:hypothetical protein NQZ68_030954 [Dissostichus eleginoides]
MAMKTPARLLILLKPDDTRKLVLPNGIPETMAQLTVEVRKVCEINGGFRMQYQDRDFGNALVNLTSTADLVDLATIKVIPIPDDGVQTPREEADNADILSTPSSSVSTRTHHEVDKESLYRLEDQEIDDLIPKVGPQSKFKNRLKLLKRKLDLQGGSSQSPASKRPREDIQGSNTEEVILSDVKNIMSCVLDKLPDQDDKLNKFLENNIKHLKTDKREVVGVFGRTGAGKSSLINAVIGEQDLLPSGSIIACTSVMIKVEANMRDPKYEADIEFITKEAKELSAELVKYTRSESKEEDAQGMKRWYWPLVKCVTFRVPKNDFLQHVTLVDLPGNGDRNKSRDTMWKKVIGSCSTVWIVADINRAAAETESWEILKESCSLMGNGGECRQIHFICTKSDIIGRSGNQSAAGVRAQILKRNEQAKRKVKAEFRKLKEVKKQLSENCFEVFTVSSDEFLEKIHLDPDETEIPKLQEILQDLNEWHSETLNYVSGARGILSLIQGASSREGTKKGSAFHRILKCLVQNGGIHKTKKGKSININMKLTSYLTDSIDEEFKKTFPNEGNSGPFNGVINAFSLGTEKLMTNKEYENVKLQLTFLKTEEEKIKTNLNKLIRERKKTIYSSLTTTIEETMKECYDKAKEFRGEGSLKNMRDTIKNYVDGSKNVMFAQAKDAMMKQLRDLKSEIPAKLKSMMQESIELSLKTDGVSIPVINPVKRLQCVHDVHRVDQWRVTADAC